MDCCRCHGSGVAVAAFPGISASAARRTGRGGLRAPSERRCLDLAFLPASLAGLDRRGGDFSFTWDACRCCCLRRPLVWLGRIRLLGRRNRASIVVQQPRRAPARRPSPWPRQPPKTGRRAPGAACAAIVRPSNRGVETPLDARQLDSVGLGGNQGTSNKRARAILRQRATLARLGRGSELGICWVFLHGCSSASHARHAIQELAPRAVRRTQTALMLAPVIVADLARPSALPSRTR